MGLDEAVAYVFDHSTTAGRQLLKKALASASGLDRYAERGRVVPEIGSASVREVFVFRYRLIYEVAEGQVQVIAFLHGARDFARWQEEEQGGA